MIRCKANRLWHRMNETSIEWTFRVSPMALILIIAAIFVITCLAKSMAKIEQSRTIRKEARRIEKESASVE